MQEYIVNPETLKAAAKLLNQLNQNFMSDFDTFHEWRIEHNSIGTIYGELSYERESRQSKRPLAMIIFKTDGNLYTNEENPLQNNKLYQLYKLLNVQFHKISLRPNAFILEIADYETLKEVMKKSRIYLENIDQTKQELAGHIAALEYRARKKSTTLTRLDARQFLMALQEEIAEPKYEQAIVNSIFSIDIVNQLKGLLKKIDLAQCDDKKIAELIDNIETMIKTSKEDIPLVRAIKEDLALLYRGIDKNYTI